MSAAKNWTYRPAASGAHFGGPVPDAVRELPERLMREIADQLPAGLVVTVILHPGAGHLDHQAGHRDTLMYASTGSRGAMGTAMRGELAMLDPAPVPVTTPEQRLEMARLYLADAEQAWAAAGLDYADVFGETLTVRIARLSSEIAALTRTIAARAAARSAA